MWEKVTEAEKFTHEEKRKRIGLEGRSHENKKFFNWSLRCCDNKCSPDFIQFSWTTEWEFEKYRYTNPSTDPRISGNNWIFFIFSLSLESILCVHTSWEIRCYRMTFILNWRRLRALFIFRITHSIVWHIANGLKYLANKFTLSVIHIVEFCIVHCSVLFFY